MAKVNIVNKAAIYENNPISRIDAEFFDKAAITIDNRLRQKPYFTLDKKRVVSGPFGSSLKSSAYLSAGEIPFIRITNVKGGFHIDTTDMVYISKFNSDRISNSELNLDDIVLSKVGNTIGYFARINEDLGKSNISENNIGIKLNGYSRSEKHYILTYLNTRYAQMLVLRRISGNAQPKLNVADVCYIPIPKFSNDLNTMISDLILQSESHKKQAIILYAAAEKLLLDILGLSDFKFSAKKTSVKGVAESFFISGRIDAEYYQEKYDQIECMLRSFPTSTINREFYTYKNSCSDVYSKDGSIGVVKTKQIYNYKVNSNVESYIKAESIISNKLTLLQPNDVIFASMGVGSLGKVGIYYGNKPLVTDSTLRIFRKKQSGMLYPEVLALFIQSNLGQELIYKYIVGSTGIINIYDNDLYKIPFPVLTDDIQKKLADNIKNAFSYNEKSKYLLERATRALELAIEQDEDKAIEWLGTQSAL